MPRAASLWIAALAAATWAPAVAEAAVVELDGATWSTFVTSESDNLVLFSQADKAACPRCAAAENFLDGVLAPRLAKAGALQLGLLHIDTHGVPPGVKVHHTPALLLIPAGGREAVEFEIDHHAHDHDHHGHDHAHDHTHHAHDQGHDPKGHDAAFCSAASATISSAGAATSSSSCSAASSSASQAGVQHTCSKCAAAAAASNKAAGATDHASASGSTIPELTLPRVLSFLKEKATFAADVPAATLADKWGERDVFPAIAEGLAVLKEQMQRLKEENARLTTELAACKAKAAARKAADAKKAAEAKKADAGMCSSRPPSA